MNRIMGAEPARLFTPGPVNIPPRVAAASSMMLYHHRTEAFSSVLLPVVERLKPLFGTGTGEVLPIHTTGRGAMDGVCRNLFCPGEKLLCVVNGNFGRMAAKAARLGGMDCVECFAGLDTAVDLAEFERLLDEHRPVGVTVVHNDTSNGVVNPIAAIGELTSARGVYLVVDCVSSLGCMPFEMDAWKVDAVVTAAQKGLMSPPGVAFAALSQRALARCAENVGQSFYIDLTDIRASLKKGQTPGTTPVSLILAVNEALNMIEDEGLENVYARHRRLARATRAAVEALGFTLYPQNCAVRSDSLTVCLAPAGVNVAALTPILREEFNIEVGVGLNPETKNGLRIAHMGSAQLRDLLEFFAALEAALYRCGALSALGCGLTAFIKAWYAAAEDAQ